MKTKIKEKNLKALSDYQRKLYKKPNLRYLYFELTDKCNLNCLHCGSSCTGHNSTFLAMGAIERTLYSVANKYDPHNIWICITGGEPLLHSRIFEVIEKSKALGFSVGMTSNGTLISENTAFRLAKSGLDTIAISIDGIAESHDTFRSSKGSFDKAITGIKNLKKINIEPQIISVIHKNNISLLEEIYKYFLSIDIQSWRLVNIDPIGRAKDNQSYLLDKDDLKELLDFIREKRFDLNNSLDITYGCSHYLGYEYENEVRDYYFQCNAGTQIASIMANGNIGGCLDIERRKDLIQGNVYTEEFIDVWENRFNLLRHDRTHLSKKCTDCTHKHICLGDSAHTWDYDNNEPLYCLATLEKEVN